jgi:hypothetical protein
MQSKQGTASRLGYGRSNREKFSMVDEDEDMGEELALMGDDENADEMFSLLNDDDAASSGLDDSKPSSPARDPLGFTDLETDRVLQSVAPTPSKPSVAEEFVAPAKAAQDDADMVMSSSSSEEEEDELEMLFKRKATGELSPTKPAAKPSGTPDKSTMDAVRNVFGNDSSSSDDSSSSSSDSDSSSSEDDGGDASDAAEDLPESVTGTKRKTKSSKGAHKRHKSNSGSASDPQEIKANRPNPKLPFNGLVDEKTFRERVQRAKDDPKSISKVAMDSKEKANLPRESYLVVTTKRCYLPYCDKDGHLNTEFISAIRKEMGKISKLTPAKRLVHSYIKETGALVALMLHRANVLFQTLWPGTPGVQFAGGIKDASTTVDTTKRAVRMVINVWSPELNEQDARDRSEAAARRNKALREHKLNQQRQEEESRNAQKQGRVVMTGLLEKIRQRKHALSSSTSANEKNFFQAKAEGARRARKEAEATLPQVLLKESEEREDVELGEGEAEPSVSKPGAVRRTVSAPSLLLKEPRLGSFGSESGSDSDDDIELVMETRPALSQPGESPSTAGFKAAADRAAKARRDLAMRSRRHHGFKMFAGSKKAKVGKKNSKGVTDGKAIRDNYFKKLRQEAANERLTSHAQLQGYASFEQWKEAERKEAAKRGQDEAQQALVAEIERKVMENQRRKHGVVESAGVGFIAAESFSEPKPGYVFKRDTLGLGYYADGVDVSALAPPTKKESAEADMKGEEAVPAESAEKASDSGESKSLKDEGPTDKPAPTAARLSPASRMAKRVAEKPKKVGALDQLFSKPRREESSVQDNVAYEKVGTDEEAGRSDDDETVEATQVVLDDDAEASSAEEENATEAKSDAPKVDRAAAYRAALAKEAESLKANRRAGSMVEEEAEESDDEERMTHGVGEYGVDDMKRREEQDRMDERMDRVTQKDVMEADLEGIVDAPSDDEGDEDADEAGFHADKLREQDEEEVAAVVKNIQEGWKGRRRGRRHGRLGTEDLVEGNKRQKGRLGLDQSDDEEVEDEEAALLSKIERERLRHGDDDYISDFDSDPEEDENVEEAEKNVTDPEKMPHDFDAGDQKATIALMRSRAKKTRALMKLEARNSASPLNIPRARSPRESSILGDETSNQILAMMQRTNVRTPIMRQDSFDAPNVMSKPQPVLRRSSSLPADPAAFSGNNATSAPTPADSNSMGPGLFRRKSMSLTASRGSFLSTGNSSSALNMNSTNSNIAPPTTFGGIGAGGAAATSAITRKFVFRSKEMDASSRSAWGTNSRSGVTSRPGSAKPTERGSKKNAEAGQLWSKLCQNRFTDE